MSDKAVVPNNKPASKKGKFNLMYAGLGLLFLALMIALIWSLASGGKARAALAAINQPTPATETNQANTQNAVANDPATVNDPANKVVDPAVADPAGADKKQSQATEWPSLSCKNTGTHSPVIVGSGAEIWMHSQAELTSAGDTCTLNVPKGMFVVVNSAAGSATVNGVAAKIGNPITVNGESDLNGTIILTWGANNASAGAMFSMFLP